MVSFLSFKMGMRHYIYWLAVLNLDKETDIGGTYFLRQQPAVSFA